MAAISSSSAMKGDSSSSGTISHAVVFSTQTQYPLPSQKYMIPANWKRYQLSQLVNKALSLTQPVPFDFLVRGEILRTTLGEWCAQHGLGEEETLEIEYIQSVLPPQRMADIPHEDWVSSVICRLQGHLLTASYDGHLRAFSYSQNLLLSRRLHAAPITSICLVPSPSSTQGTDSALVASASHDLTGQIARVDFSPRVSATEEASTSPRVQPLATLHLHTAPVSSIAASSSGSHILTSSWDGLIGLWDMSIPESDEVPADAVHGGDRKSKRRKLVDGSEDKNRPKRKAPTAVLKSHTARVSKVVFGSSSVRSTAYSCGFDSTVRTWDVESGVCTNTITSPEKPFLDLAVSVDENMAFAASTDRTITIYDIRASTSSASLSPVVGSFVHVATPSCLALSSSKNQQLVSGAYDGVARIWDLRSMKSAIASFKAWEGKGSNDSRKILALDWANGVVGIGGELGFEIWRCGDEQNVGAS